MVQQDLMSIPRSMIDAFNQRNMDQLVRLISDQAEWIDVPTQTMFRGKAGYRQFDEGWLKAFPDGKIEIIDIIAASDRVVVEYVGRGTQTGPLQGPEGVIDPTGLRVQLPLCDVMQIQGGLVVRGRTYYDRNTLLRQIRAELPAAA